MLALSKSQGADQTLQAQYGSDAARNGEPFGELAMVRQSDAGWGDQHGGPRDPQGPNSQASRDVRVSAGNLPIWQSAAGPDTVTHEMGNAMGFQETSGHGVMSDTLSPGERFLLDHLGLDGNPDRPISDATLMQLAKRAVELNFDLGTNGAGAGGSVDWHAAADVNWDPSYSPFKSGKDVKGAAQNFTDYLVKIAPSKEFDALGKALNGSKKAAR